MTLVQRRRALRARSTPRPSPRCRRRCGPRTARWTGAAARATVLVYNTDPADPRPSCPTRVSWTSPTPRGRAAGRLSPTGADFQAIVAPSSTSRARPRPAVARGPQGQREGLPGNNVAHAGGGLRRGPGRRSSTTTTGTATRPRPGGQRRAASCTSSPTRTPARSSASPVPASSPRATPADAREVRRFLTGPRGRRCWPKSDALEYPLSAGVQPRTPGAARSPTSSRPRSTSRPRRAEGRRADDRGRVPLSCCPRRTHRRGCARLRRTTPGTRRPGGRPSVPRPLLAAGIAVAAVTLLPVVVVVDAALDLRPRGAARFLLRPRVGRAARQHHAPRRALRGRACLVLGTGAGWLVERTTCRCAGCGRGSSSRRSPCPRSSTATLGVAAHPAPTGYAGAVLVVSLSYFPLVYLLPVAAALRRLDPAPRGVRPVARAAPGRGLRPRRPAAAADGGAGRSAPGGPAPARRVRRPGAASASRRSPSRSSSSTTRRSPATAAEVLALVLVVLCLGLLGLEQAARGRARYARLGPGAGAAPRPMPLGRWTTPAARPRSPGSSVLALAVPLGSLARWLGAAPDALSEAASDAAALRRPRSPPSGSPSSAARRHRASRRSPSPGSSCPPRRRSTAVVERAPTSPARCPAIVVALALVTLTVRDVPVLYQSQPLLVTALRRPLPAPRRRHRCAPRWRRPRPSSPRRRPGARRRAPGARCCGSSSRSPCGALAGVRPVSLVATSTELTATLLLAPIGTRTLATGFWSASASLDYARARRPTPALMVALSASAGLAAAAPPGRGGRPMTARRPRHAAAALTVRGSASPGSAATRCCAGST